MFTSESVDGENVAKEFKRRERDIDEARAARWIQANAWRADAPQARALAPAQWNVLSVHIGPSAARRDDAAFPEAKVDFTRGDVAVTVQLELAGAAVTSLETDGVSTTSLLELVGRLEALAAGSDDSAAVGIASSEINLPPAGDSMLARFGVYPQKRTGQVEGRIAIIHNNRCCRRRA